MTKQILAWLLAILAWASVAAGAAGSVPDARDLQKDAAAARAVDGALLVVLVGQHCVYCERVLNEFLIPMSGNRQYREKVVMRRLVVSDDTPIRDFEGRPSTPRKLARQYGYSLVPTVLLLDGKGRMLAKPVVGLTTVDYYGMYLDEAIDLAVGKIRGKAGAPAPL
ncbi:MAG: hypothetical protein WC474_01965 [Hydrogenophilaceae bacterium]